MQREEISILADQTYRSKVAGPIGSGVHPNTESCTEYLREDDEWKGDTPEVRSLEQETTMSNVSW